METILIIVAIVIAILLITPQGRNALKKLFGIAGSQADIAVGKLNTPDAQVVALDAEVTAQTTQTLGEVHAADVRARLVIEAEEKRQQERKKWIQNRDMALEQLGQLQADKIDDAEQHEQIGQVKANGEMAMSEIERIDAECEMSKEQVAQARQQMKQAEEFRRALPADARRLLAEGNLAAAAQELAKAQKQLASTQTAFSTNKAVQMLEGMKKSAMKSKAEAASLQAQVDAAPASADVVAQRLQNLKKKTSFEEFAAQQKAQAEAK